jgi:hypothetical protein
MKSTATEFATTSAGHVAPADPPPSRVALVAGEHTGEGQPGRLEFYDVILRHVPHYGWLFILQRPDGTEDYRSDFHHGAMTAAIRGLSLAETIYVGAKP